MDGIVERLDKHGPNFSWAIAQYQLVAIEDFRISKIRQLWIKTFDGRSFYFLHSFAASANSLSSRASAEYEGVQFSAIASCQNIIGVQFHPEKSGEDWSDVFKSFFLRRIFNLLTFYGLPEEVVFCRRCVISNQRPSSNR